MVRRLTAIRIAGAAPDALAGARAACQFLHHELSLWLGVDGSRALFNSAIGRARPDHPVLSDIQHEALLSPTHPAIARGVQIHGTGATVAALESTLVVLIQLLGRLIGDDMATRIVENSEKNDAGIARG
ncbi:MAG: hypothetical protein ACR2G6_12195 [Gemmatimonadaceae bacterium]